MSAPDGALGEGRTKSVAPESENSQTAEDFIHSQLQLEADAREALPYKFDTCTRPLGSLRQLLFACLTCNPPTGPAESHIPAAVCYSCSVSCHGEHDLVELFNKRNFVCDCGTTRMPITAPCSLRLNPATNQKGSVVSEVADVSNRYNHNFRNRFCGCECDYDPHQQKGTMFQCLGLGHTEDGGCGEDWWHPSCVVGLDPAWHEVQKTMEERRGDTNASLVATVTDIAAAVVEQREPDVAAEASPEPLEVDEGDDDFDDDVPTPPGFPQEDDFEGFLCYKCVDSNPWIKRYAGTKGFLAPVFRRSAAPSPEAGLSTIANTGVGTGSNGVNDHADISSRKRKAVDEGSKSSIQSKRVKDEESNLNALSAPTSTTGTLDKANEEYKDAAETRPCTYKLLPEAPTGRLSLFFKSDFRDHLCRCSDCFPTLARHPQLMEEEAAYEPPLSEDGEDEVGSTVGSGSLLDRGERALTNVDRVRAIEGVMAYNQLKEKLTPFFKEFAQSGKAISAEDIKAHFAKMRGDEEAIKEAGEGAARSSDNRREQSGY